MKPKATSVGGIRSKGASALRTERAPAASRLPSMIARLDYLGPPAEERVRSLLGTGVDAVLVDWPNHTPYCFGWDGRDRYDYRPMDAQLDALAEIDPEVRFIVSFGSLHGAPYYWALDHREELALFRLGLPMQAPSLASELWFHDSAEAARRFAVHFRQGRHGARLLGFAPFSTGVDWHGVGETRVDISDKETPQGVAHPKEGDFSEPMRRAFRRFLGAKYGSDAALQAAWRTTDVTVASAPLPSREDVRSPLPHVADYFECYNRLNARQAVVWCEALKQGAPDCLVGLTHALVYGYPNREAIHPQGCGHNAPEELLASNAVDFLMSGPADEADAANPLGQHAVDSLRLAGKAHVQVFEGANLQLVSEEEQCDALTLAAGYAAVKGSRLALGEARWGELSPGGAHEQFSRLPYDGDRIRGLLGRLRAWHGRQLSAAAPSLADVATFVSPRGSYRRAMEKGFGETRIERFRNEVLLRSGLCFDEYLLGDFARVAARYRFWIFIDCPDIGEADWRAATREPSRCCFATSGDPIAEPARLREAAAAAGAHIWCDSDDAVFANAGLLMFVAQRDGAKRVALPRPLTVTDAFSGAVVGEQADSITFTARKGSATLFGLQAAGQAEIPQKGRT